MAHSFIDKFGYRRQTANPISRVGVFPYTGEQIDQPKRNPYTGEAIVKRDALGQIVYKRTKSGAIAKDKDGEPIPEYEMMFGLEPNKLYPVFRGPEALFDPKAIESFNGLPIRIGHLMIGDEKKNDKADKDKKLNSADKNPNDGCIYNVRPSLDEKGYLIADFCIYTDRMKDILRAGKIKELSLGYTCIYEPEQGEYEGVPYMFKQTNLRGNHLALVKNGRCGSSVCVYDEAIVTFDSLPYQIKENPMEIEKKEESNKLDRAKALASAIKGGDEQLAQDCLDFADFPPEVRKEALERCKAAKCEKEKDGEKETTDKAPKAAKDDADAPIPPELPKPKEEKPAESPAPESSAASAPVPTPAPEANDNPAPADVPSPKDGENPVQDKGCKDKAVETPVCDKCGLEGCTCAEKDEAKADKEKATKDCGTGVTEPSIPVPVSAVEGTKEKDEKETEDKACKDSTKEAVIVEGEKVEEPKPGEAIVEAIEAKAEDKEVKKIDPDVKDEHTEVPPKKDKVAQDEYASFIAEYTEAQALANRLRPHIKVTFDSAPMRVIDVARFAAQHIDNLSFVMDEADDDKVLTAVRGFAAAVTMDSAPIQKEVFEDVVPSADVLVQDEAPKQTTSKSSGKELLAFLGQ